MTTETAAPHHESVADVSERLAAPLDLLLTMSANASSPTLDDVERTETLSVGGTTMRVRVRDGGGRIDLITRADTIGPASDCFIDRDDNPP
jgi:hypothetical protein